MLDIHFTPETASEEDYEAAKQRIANLCDEWPWLAQQINSDRLTWNEIFALFAPRI